MILAHVLALMMWAQHPTTVHCEHNGTSFAGYSSPEDACKHGESGYCACGNKQPSTGTLTYGNKQKCHTQPAGDGCNTVTVCDGKPLMSTLVACEGTPSEAQKTIATDPQALGDCYTNSVKGELVITHFATFATCEDVRGFWHRNDLQK